jgi:hypothetical protein
VRYFAEHDLERFERILVDIEALRPGFVPKGPFPLRTLSRMFGYRNAARASVFYRKLKKLWRSHDATYARGKALQGGQIPGRSQVASSGGGRQDLLRR